MFTKSSIAQRYLQHGEPKISLGKHTLKYTTDLFGYEKRRGKPYATRARVILRRRGNREFFELIFCSVIAARFRASSI